jgi:hypothetical protein
VTRERDPSCPVPGRPCLRVLDDYLIELARFRAREDRGRLHPCRNCGERNVIALGGKSRCYGCRVRPVERDHIRGSGSGPAAIRGDANLNRISEEGERIMRDLRLDDLCTPCQHGYALRLGIFLGRQEVDL